MTGFVVNSFLTFSEEAASPPPPPPPPPPPTTSDFVPAGVSFSKEVILQDFTNASTGTSPPTDQALTPAFTTTFEGGGSVSSASTGSTKTDAGANKFSGGYVSFTNLDILDNDADFTVEARIRITAVPSGVQHVMGQYGSGADTRRWAVETNNGLVRLVAGNSDGSATGTTSDGTTTLLNGIEYEVAVGYDIFDQTLSLYVNGNLETSITFDQDAVISSPFTVLGDAGGNALSSAELYEFRYSKGVDRYGNTTYSPTAGLLTIEGTAYPNTAHRFWRWRLTANNDYAGQPWLCEEIRAFDAETPRNQLKTAPSQAIAGVVFDSARVASNAFDKDNDTDFGVLDFLPTDDTWVGHDFGAGNRVELGRFEIDERQGFFNAQGFIQLVVEYSDDGTSWTPYWAIGARGFDNLDAGGSNTTRSIYDNPYITDAIDGTYRHFLLAYYNWQGPGVFSIESIEISNNSTLVTDGSSDDYSLSTVNGSNNAARVDPSFGASVISAGDRTQADTGSYEYHVIRLDRNDPVAVDNIKVRARPTQNTTQTPQNIGVFVSNGGPWQFLTGKSFTQLGFSGDEDISIPATTINDDGEEGEDEAQTWRLNITETNSPGDGLALRFLALHSEPWDVMENYEVTLSLTDGGSTDPRQMIYPPAEDTFSTQTVSATGLTIDVDNPFTIDYDFGPGNSRKGDFLRFFNSSITRTPRTFEVQSRKNGETAFNTEWIVEGVGFPLGRSFCNLGSFKNLLANPGFATGDLSGWTSSSGSHFTVATVQSGFSPDRGEFAAYCINTATSTLQQDIDVSSDATDIDAGVGYYGVFWEYASWAAPDTSSRVTVEYRDASNNVIETTNFERFLNSPLFWEGDYFPVFLPPLTRTLRVIFSFLRDGGVTRSVAQQYAAVWKIEGTRPIDTDFDSVVLLLDGEQVPGPTAGNTYTDLSTAAKVVTNTGSVRSGSTFNPGVAGQFTAAEFVAGPLSRLEVGAGDTDFRFDDAFTIEWRGTIESINTSAGIFGIGGGILAEDTLLVSSVAGGSGSIDLFIGNGSATGSTINSTLLTSANDGEPVEIAVTFDGTQTYTLYINGQVAGQTTLSGSFQSSQPLHIGATLDTVGNNVYTGALHEFRFTKGVDRYGGMAYTPTVDKFPRRGPPSA